MRFLSRLFGRRSFDLFGRKEDRRVRGVEFVSRRTGGFKVAKIQLPTTNKCSRQLESPSLNPLELTQYTFTRSLNSKLIQRFEERCERWLSGNDFFLFLASFFLRRFAENRYIVNCHHLAMFF